MLKIGFVIIDAPGMWEIGLIDVSYGIDQIFYDISRLAANCKYADRSHLSEQGCAVLSAVEFGGLDINII